MKILSKKAALLEKRLKITAAEILQFDPSKRRLKTPKPISAPKEPKEEEEYTPLQEAREALLILYNVSVYNGEEDLANRAKAAYYALTDKTL
jgi:hypothetical protein